MPYRTSMGDYYSLDKRVTLSILLALVITNAIWVVVSEHSGPVIALVVYVFVAFLCWRRNHLSCDSKGDKIRL